jgi:hypothetical protein
MQAVEVVVAGFDDSMDFKGAVDLEFRSPSSEISPPGFGKLTMTGIRRLCL